jgi:hypothetical protein
MRRAVCLDSEVSLPQDIFLHRPVNWKEARYVGEWSSLAYYCSVIMVRKNANASLVNISIIAIFCNSNHCHHHELFWISLKPLLLNPLWVICPSRLLDAFFTVTSSAMVNFLALFFVYVLYRQCFIIFIFIKDIWVIFFSVICFSFVIWSCSTYIGILCRNVISVASRALMYLWKVPDCR